MSKYKTYSDIMKRNLCVLLKPRPWLLVIFFKQKKTHASLDFLEKWWETSFYFGMSSVKYFDYILLNFCFNWRRRRAVCLLKRNNNIFCHCWFYIVVKDKMRNVHIFVVVVVVAVDVYLLLHRVQKDGVIGMIFQVKNENSSLFSL